jgi:hypothetical protein
MSILTATGDVAVSPRTAGATPVSAVYLGKWRSNTDLLTRKPYAEQFSGACRLWQKLICRQISILIAWFNISIPNYKMILSKNTRRRECDIGSFGNLFVAFRRNMSILPRLWTLNLWRPHFVSKRVGIIQGRIVTYQRLGILDKTTVKFKFGSYA